MKLQNFNPITAMEKYSGKMSQFFTGLFIMFDLVAFLAIVIFWPDSPIPYRAFVVFTILTLFSAYIENTTKDNYD